MSKYIDADLLRKEIEKRLKNIRDYMNGVGMKYKGPKYFKAQGKESAYDALLNIIESLQQEQPDTCIFGNTPSEEACKFCGVDCELREPKQSGITSTNLSSTNEAVGLAIMAYLDTKVKHDNAKVCGVSLRVAREWIREKIANKQEQPEVDLEVRKQIEELANDWHHKGFASDEDCPLCMQDLIDILWHFYELGLNARKEE